MHHRYTYKHLMITDECKNKNLQNSEVLKSSKVALGDTCDVISIQLPVKTDTNIHN